MEIGPTPKSLIKIVVVASPVRIPSSNCVVTSKVTGWVVSLTVKSPVTNKVTGSPSVYASGIPSISVGLKVAMGNLVDSRKVGFELTDINLYRT